jgi:Tol biopolymer transport system component
MGNLRRNKMKSFVQITVISVAILATLGCSSMRDPHRTPEDKAGRSPLDELPSYVKRVTHFGQRADWSHDGKRILFLEKTYGDVYEVELASGIIRPMTHHYYHEGYTRALYLSNGDILLSGAKEFDARKAGASRSEKNAELWILKKDLSKRPVPLGENCKEGPAVSRRHLRFAWARGNAIYMADIAYEGGTPKLVNKRTILDGRKLPFKCGLETQNLRPPDEKELIFSAYGYQETEVCGLNIETGEVRNYSNSPKTYEEPEGIFPDGKHTLVECNQHMKNPHGIQEIDIYKLALDGSSNFERITRFADYPGFKASNPVVSDDGGYIAFQVANKGDKAGVGRGILVLDLERHGKTNPRNSVTGTIKETGHN